MKWWLVDWPADATFLTPEERTVLLGRLKVDRAEEASMDRWNAKRIFGDAKVYMGVLMFLGIVNVSNESPSGSPAADDTKTNYSTNFFIPTILVEMGYTAISAQVSSLEIPPNPGLMSCRFTAYPYMR